MCWTSKKHINPITADKDVHVYKICLEHGLAALPYYQTAREFYEEGKTYKADRLDEPYQTYEDHFYEIYHGMHSYSCKCQLIQGAITSDVNLINIDTLAAKDYYMAHYNKNLRLLLVLCSIPKGATYYVNESGEYVSESIKIEKFFAFNVYSIDKMNKILKRWDNEQNI